LRRNRLVLIKTAVKPPKSKGIGNFYFGGAVVESTTVRKEIRLAKEVWLQIEFEWYLRAGYSWYHFNKT